MDVNNIEPFLDKFDEKDLNKKGSIGLEEFKELFPGIMGGDHDEAETEMYFRGINKSCSGRITRQEYTEFIIGALNKDMNYIMKMGFRSFDLDRKKQLDAENIKHIVKYTGSQLSDEEINEVIENLTGDKNGRLTYAQVHKMVTGQDIDPNTDPYDGQLPKKYCLLI